MYFSSRHLKELSMLGYTSKVIVMCHLRLLPTHNQKQYT